MVALPRLSSRIGNNSNWGLSSGRNRCRRDTKKIYYDLMRGTIENSALPKKMNSFQKRTAMKKWWPPFIFETEILLGQDAEEKPLSSMILSFKRYRHVLYSVACDQQNRKRRSKKCWKFSFSDSCLNVTTIIKHLFDSHL